MCLSGIGVRGRREQETLHKGRGAVFEIRLKGICSFSAEAVRRVKQVKEVEVTRGLEAGERCCFVEVSGEPEHAVRPEKRQRVQEVGLCPFCER